jgi:hypothetical protein
LIAAYRKHVTAAVSTARVVGKAPSKAALSMLWSHRGALGTGSLSAFLHATALHWLSPWIIQGILWSLYC